MNQPHADHGRIVLASLDYTVTCHEWDGTIIWRRCFEQPFVACPARWSHLLILVGHTGTIDACHPETSNVIGEVARAARIASTPVLAKVTSLIATAAGTLIQLAADGQIDEATDLSARCVATPLPAARYRISRKPGWSSLSHTARAGFEAERSTLRVIVHVLIDDPLVAEVDKLPDPEHQYVLRRNPWRRDGKRLTTTVEGVTIVLHPWHRITCSELLDEGSDQRPSQLLTVFRDEH